MKRYSVHADVTISIHCSVMARSKREAIKKAAELPMGAIHEHVDSENVFEEWHTSGELDGSPKNITAEQQP